MNITFNSVKLKNFFSFESAEINLNTNGYTLVSGINKNPDDLAKSNGSGKSSIWEAITWAVTGETIRGTKDIKRIGATDKEPCTVELCFTVDKDTYRVIRSKDPTSLKVFINDVDESGKGIRDTQVILENRLPDLTSSLMGSVIVLGQGLPQRFTNNSPSGRKEILEKLSKSDFMISDLKERISKRLSTLNSNIRDTEISVAELKGRKDMLSKEIETAQQQIESINNISKLEKDYEHICKEESEFKQSVDSLCDEIQDKESIYTKLMSDKNDCVGRKVKEADAIRESFKHQIELTEGDIAFHKAEIGSLQREINRLESIKDVCPTCGQKLQGVVKPDTTEQHKRLDNFNTELYALADVLEVTKGQMQIQLDNSSKSFDEELNSYESQIKEIIRTIDTLKDNLSVTKSNYDKAYRSKISLETELESLRGKEKELTESINNYKKELLSVDEKILYNNNEKNNLELHLAVVNKFNTSITRDFRGYLLKGVIEYISNKSKEYSQIVFDTDKIDFALSGNNIDISYNGKSYESLSGGEKQKVDLIVQFAIRDMLCKYLGFSSNILVLDEIFDNLDSVGCQNILNLISAKLNDVQSIFIVTHHSDIPIPNDDEIIVEKGTDNISRITKSV